MVNRYSFKGSSVSGASGATQVIALLKKNPLTIEVKDAQNDKEYQSKGIDIIWKRKTKDGGTKDVTFDVKWDSYKSQNFAFELVSMVEKNTPGCFLSSQADFWIYGFPALNEIYILPMNKVRAWFKETENKGKKFETRMTSTRVGTNSWHTQVALVPIKAVLKNLTVGKGEGLIS